MSSDEPARAFTADGRPLPAGYELYALDMGRMIGAALAEDGMSQAEFARRVGISEKHLSQVVTGQAAASHAQLDYLAFALGRQWTVALKKRDETRGGGATT